MAAFTQATDVMDLKRSFQILEVRYGASEKEVRQSYRDLASVWHPDRFSGNPRLQTRAEEKLKEANAAYETLRSFYHEGEGGGDSPEISGGNCAIRPNGTGKYRRSFANGTLCRDRHGGCSYVVVASYQESGTHAF